MPESFTHLHARFTKHPFLASLGVRLTTLEQGRCVMTVPLGPQMRQHHGYGHAGVTFTLGDSAAGYAAMSILQPDQDVLTSDINIRLLRPAMGDELVATGTIIKPGRRLIVVNATIHAVTGGQSTLIANLTGSMIPFAAE